MTLHFTLTLLLIAILTQLSTATIDQLVNLLPAGTYYRPVGTHLVSGFVNATTPFRRSPCPALNTLANHGYLPRDGKNVTKLQIQTAMEAHFHLAPALAMMLAGQTTDPVDLNAFAVHNFIEHDASLCRKDVHFGGDQSLIVPKLTSELFQHANPNGTFGVEELAKARQARMKESNATNPEFTFGPVQQFVASGELALILRAFGGNNSEEASVENVASFIILEKFPEGFERPSTEITSPLIAETRVRLQAVTE